MLEEGRQKTNHVWIKQQSKLSYCRDVIHIVLYVELIIVIGLIGILMFQSYQKQQAYIETAEFNNDVKDFDDFNLPTSTVTNLIDETNKYDITTVKNDYDKNDEIESALVTITKMEFEPRNDEVILDQIKSETKPEQEINIANAPIDVIKRLKNEEISENPIWEKISEDLYSNYPDEYDHHDSYEDDVTSLIDYEK